MRAQGSCLDITVTSPGPGGRGVSSASLDGAMLECPDGLARVLLDGGTHRIEIVLRDAPGQTIDPVPHI